MSEERLIEITSEIIKHDGPLGRMAYISTLREEEIKLLRSYMNNPIYEELNIYDRVLKFSQDYLESKNISFMNVMGEEKGEVDNQQEMFSYLERMLADDKDVYIPGHKARK